jgi:hypothetical protein
MFLTEMVSFLLEEGSQDLEQVGRAAGRDWSPLKLARYHNVYKILKDKLHPRVLQEGKFRLHQSKVAQFHRRICDGCFCVGLFLVSPSLHFFLSWHANSTSRKSGGCTANAPMIIVSRISTSASNAAITKSFFTTQITSLEAKWARNLTRITMARTMTI